MTNRVALGALPGGGYGLLVSKPGVNVLGTMHPNQVAFDSRWALNSRIHQVATVTIPASSTFPPLYASFPFGVDFGVIPPVFAFAVSGSTLRGISEGMDGELAYWENYDPITYSRMRVFSNRVEFQRLPSVTTNRYFVLRPL